MANSGQSAFGSTLLFTYGTSSTTISIDQITKVGLSGGSIGKIDISSMSGPTTKVKEYISGMIEPGQFTVDCNFDATVYGNINGVVGTSGTWLMKFNDTTATTKSRFSATGYLEPLNFDGPMDGAPITQTLTITLSGAVSYTAKS
jgi:hypothetical protein